MIQYSTSLSGVQVCDNADPSQQYTYTVTFSNLDLQWCTSVTPITVSVGATTSADECGQCQYCTHPCRGGYCFELALYALGQLGHEHSLRGDSGSNS